MAELADALDSKSRFRRFGFCVSFPENSLQRPSNKAYKTIATFAPTGAKWRKKGADLPSFAKCIPLVNWLWQKNSTDKCDRASESLLRSNAGLCSRSAGPAGTKEGRRFGYGVAGSVKIRWIRRLRVENSAPGTEEGMLLISVSIGRRRRFGSPTGATR